MKELPFWIAEDDVVMKWDAPILPKIPADADIVYLATSHSGCAPDPEPWSRFLPPTTAPYLALAQVYDENYVRLYSMISAVALLILTEKGRDRYRLEQRKAFRRDQPVDVRYAFAMPDLNVYALRSPMFAERMDIQIPSKRNENRRSITHNPIPIATEGECRTVRNSRYVMEVATERDTERGGLRWVVQNYAKQPHAGKEMAQSSPPSDN